MSTLLADLGNTRLKLYFEGKVSCFSTNNYFDIEEFQRLISAKEFDSVKVVYSTPELVFEKFLENVGSSSIEIIGSKLLVITGLPMVWASSIGTPKPS